MGKNIVFKFSFFGDLIFPLTSIAGFFYICLWRFDTFSWDSRMYLALLIAVFSNYFMIKQIQGKKNEIRYYYVSFWEILVPLIVLGLLVFSIIIELNFFKTDSLVDFNQVGLFCILFCSVVLFFFFLSKGISWFLKWGVRFF